MLGGDALSAALARYLSVPAVAAWLTTPAPVASVSARALANSFVYAIAFGLDARSESPLAAPARARMDVEDMLCVCEVTADNFALGMVYGLAQPHVFARTPLMASATPTARRFAVDLSQTRCLEFMEFVHFDNRMVCCNYRQFLHSPDASLPVVVRATLHAPGAAPGVLGEVVMRAEIFEAVTCPVCRRDNYACECPFEAKSKVMSSRVVTRSWTHFTSKFMRKARHGKIRLSMTAVVPAVGEVPVLTQDVDSLNVLVQGQSEYMTLMRRKAVHGLGLGVTYARTDEPLVELSEAADFLSLHNEHVSRRSRAKRPLLPAAEDSGRAAAGAAAERLEDELLRGLDASFVAAANVLPPSRPTSESSREHSAGTAYSLSLAAASLETRHGSSMRDELDRGDELDVMLGEFAATSAMGRVLESADTASGELDQILLRVVMGGGGDGGGGGGGGGGGRGGSAGLRGARSAGITVDSDGGRAGNVFEGGGSVGAVITAPTAAVDPLAPESPPQPPGGYDPQLAALLGPQYLVEPPRAHGAPPVPAFDPGRGFVDVPAASPLQDYGGAAMNGGGGSGAGSGGGVSGDGSAYSAWHSVSRPGPVSQLPEMDAIPEHKLPHQPMHHQQVNHMQQQPRPQPRQKSQQLSSVLQAQLPEGPHAPAKRRRPAEAPASHAQQLVPAPIRRADLVASAGPDVPGDSGASSSAPVLAPEVALALDTAAPPRPRAVPKPSAPGGSAGADDERKHVCTVCPSRFKMRGDLQRHIKVVHEKTKKYVCSTCGKAFGHSGHLNRHEQSHRGVRRFKCTHCGYDFHQRSHLVSHIEHIHSPSKGREHECSLCKLRVATVSELRQHLRTVHNLAGMTTPD